MSTKQVKKAEIENAKEVIYLYAHELARTHVHKIEQLVEDSLELAKVDQHQAAEDIFEDTKDAFYALLLRRNARGNSNIVTALNKVIESPDFKDEDGLKFINRYFYSICNYLHLEAGHEYITEHLRLLIEHLLNLPTLEAKSWSTRLLQQRVHAFRNHDYAKCLQRQMHLDGSNKTGKVIDTLHDFPYLWGVTTGVKETDESTKNSPRTGIGQKIYQRRCNDYRALHGHIKQAKQGTSNLVVPLPWNSSTREFNQALKYFKSLYRESRKKDRRR